jgi:hypothetical protein
VLIVFFGGSGEEPGTGTAGEGRKGGGSSPPMASGGRHNIEVLVSIGYAVHIGPTRPLLSYQSTPLQQSSPLPQGRGAEEREPEVAPHIYLSGAIEPSTTGGARGGGPKSGSGGPRDHSCRMAPVTASTKISQIIEL